jgi:hypothetical protein
VLGIRRRPFAATIPTASRALAPSSAYPRPRSRCACRRTATENPRQLAKVPWQPPRTRSGRLGKRNRPITGAGVHRFAWPMSRPERRSSKTIYNAATSRFLLPPQPVQAGALAGSSPAARESYRPASCASRTLGRLFSIIRRSPPSAPGRLHPYNAAIVGSVGSMPAFVRKEQQIS